VRLRRRRGAPSRAAPRNGGSTVSARKVGPPEQNRGDLGRPAGCYEASLFTLMKRRKKSDTFGVGSGNTTCRHVKSTRLIYPTHSHRCKRKFA
jgi:hypothetical protein